MKHIDCPALHQRSQHYPFGHRVPLRVRMRKTTTADPMPVIGHSYIKGAVPNCARGELFPAWTNSHGAVAAVLADGSKLGLKPDEFEVESWHTRVYLAGPMSGLPDMNYPAFNAEAARLRALGYQVENPAENPVQPSWEDYMKQAIAQMLTCDLVALLPNWHESRGAMLEHHIASNLSILRVMASDLGARYGYYVLAQPVQVAAALA
jgi:hypothetical protein